MLMQETIENRLKLTAIQLSSPAGIRPAFRPDLFPFRTVLIPAISAMALKLKETWLCRA
jgi:hypothetical protein